ncbi:MAG: flagellar basal body rod protein FlgC [Armatimonadetes bacterium]|nr:flagellar basal body rod protein FlgC [Armatimonadota bacterium]
MNFFQSMDIAASAMSAERFRMDVISQNIANANTQTTLSGTPYRRQVAVVTPGDASPFALPVGLDDDDEEGPQFNGNGVKVGGVAQDGAEFRYVYDPTNPNAEKEGKWKGYVAMPNVNIITEMTDLIAASRSYEASATAVESAKGIAMKGLEIGTR